MTDHAARNHNVGFHLTFLLCFDNLLNWSKQVNYDMIWYDMIYGDENMLTLMYKLNIFSVGFGTYLCCIKMVVLTSR
jgi:hypothetical protein